MSVLNLHEEERQKPENWIAVGWMPNNDHDLTKRLGQGYESDKARKIRLFHDCLFHVLSNWDNQTKSAQNHLGRLSASSDAVFPGWIDGGSTGNNVSAKLFYIYLNIFKICEKL